MRFVRHAVVVAVGLLFMAGLAPPASGTADVIVVKDFDFTPAAYVGILGGAVQWDNNVGPSMHEPVQDAPLNLWKRPVINVGSSSTPINLFDVGTFAYHCAIHPFMHGTVQVPVTTNITSGSVGDVIRINVATQAHPNFTFDVARKIGSGTWTTFKTGVTHDWVSMRANAAGTYRFKALLVRIRTKAVSGWSPSAAVTIS
jgi:plastocyanin